MIAKPGIPGNDAMTKEQVNILYMAARYTREKYLAEKARLELEEVSHKADRHRNSDEWNRIYNFYGPVSLESISIAHYILGVWARQSKDPITVRFTSPGGEVRSGLGLYDIISSFVDSGIPVTTVAMGAADSMAAVLIQAGSRRLIGSNSYMTLHEIQIQHQDPMMAMQRQSVSDREEEDARIRKLNDRLVRILASKSKVDAATIAKKIKKDWVLDPEDAVEHGFVDATGYL